MSSRLKASQLTKSFLTHEIFSGVYIFFILSRFDISAELKILEEKLTIQRISFNTKSRDKEMCK